MESIEVAVASAKEASKPVLIFVSDDRNPASGVLEKFFLHDDAHDMTKKFAVTQVAFSKDDEQLKEFKIRKGATIYYLDPMSEKKKVRKVSAKSPKKLSKQLDKLLKKFEKARAVAEDA